MGRDAGKVWPFAVLPPDEQTDQHKREVRFLVRAHEAGHRAYTFGAGDYGATARDGRSGEIIRRGRNRWAVAVGGDGQEHPAAYFDDFDSAAEAVLRWLHGQGDPL
jgi:hypothetical protein